MTSKKFVELDDVNTIHHQISKLLKEHSRMDTAHHHKLVEIRNDLSIYLGRWAKRESPEKVRRGLE